MTVEQRTSTTEVDDDGDPVWVVAEGAPLVPDVQAWRRLGVGGRCEAWLGWCGLLWAPVVVKLPRPHQVDHPRARASLGREVRALEGILHPHLPHLYRHDLGAGLPYVVQEHVGGSDLDDLLARRRIPAGAAALLGSQLLSALLPLHARGVAHLDVTPANVVVRDGHAVLIDLGSSRRLGSRQPAGRPVGTLGYASPEMEACEPVSAAMDVYGVGAVLRETLARRWPGPGSAALADAVERLTAPDPSTRPSVRAALDLVARCLPRQRPAWPGWARPTDPPIRSAEAL
ncbi:serine/threonine-protein kinase [Microlunatus antarcticus]|uniref:non-specific serine/threonine protein kinase n=1 Tax=Microlunatus antarcticus TaxID=53388 RepID=A0A7W5P5U6_9ACTN|nr:serine/threonine-protein kinase [Microlunatus antarcticus]MBB3325672.1 serine/threonine protein kinase [Microlunatus antarcticus]